MMKYEVGQKVKANGVAGQIADRAEWCDNENRYRVIMVDGRSAWFPERMLAAVADEAPTAPAEAPVRGKRARG